MRLMVGDLVLKVERAMIRVKGKGIAKERRGQECIEYLLDWSGRVRRSVGELLY